MNSMFKTPFVIGLLGLALIILSFFLVYNIDYQTKPKHSSGAQFNISNVNIGGKLSLTDMNNNKVTEKSLLGKYTLIYFGFTYCPDICPLTLTTISNAINQLTPEQLKKIQIWFVSVDNERDTPENLKSYVSNFHSKITGLTGTTAQLEEIAKNYKIFYSKVDEKGDGNYLINHSSIIYLFDENGKLSAYFPKTLTTQDIISTINKVIK